MTGHEAAERAKAATAFALGMLAGAVLCSLGANVWASTAGTVVWAAWCGARWLKWGAS